jgi:hypothetical protein
MVLIHYNAIDILIVPLNASTVYHILEMFVVGIVFGRMSLFVSISIVIMDENHKPKRLWSFIKSKQTNPCGVAPLKRDWIAYNDARMKANILNNQFT